MARTTLDTGSNGIQLQLEYGSLVDNATGGSITADTTSVRFSNLEAWIDANGYPFYDSSNELTASGGWVPDDSWSNIDIPTTSGTRKLKELGKQSQAIKFGGTNGSYAVSLTITGINAAGTMSGSRSWTAPRRPYHAPGTPGVGIDANVFTVSGAQLNTAADSYWEYIAFRVETNDVWSDYATLDGDVTSNGIAMAENSRYRAQVYAMNEDATGGAGLSDYYYTVPSTPSALTCARQATKTTVVLEWTNNAQYVGAYLIERSLNDGAYAQIGTSTTTSFTDTSVPLGSTASYRVRVQSPTGANTQYSAYSAVASVNEGWAAPAAPANVVLTRNSDAAATITITGNQNSQTADGYWQTVEWVLYDFLLNVVASGTGLAGTTTSIPVSGLTTKQGYLATVRSRNEVGGASAWKESGYIYTTPGAPINLTASRAGAASSSVNVAWATGGGFIGVYQVERSTNGGGTWSQVGSVPAGTLAFVDTLPVASSALYRVRAQTPAPAVASPYTGTVFVSVALITDKTKIPSVDRIYVGTERVRQVFLGTAKIWVDGDE